MAFNNNSCVIIDNTGSVLASGRLEGKLFVLGALEIHANIHDAKSALRENTENVWHQRYGHLGKNNLRILQHNKLKPPFLKDRPLELQKSWKLFTVTCPNQKSSWE